MVYKVQGWSAKTKISLIFLKKKPRNWVRSARRWVAEVKSGPRTTCWVKTNAERLGRKIEISNGDRKGKTSEEKTKYMKQEVIKWLEFTELEAKHWMHFKEEGLTLSNVASTVKIAGPCAEMDGIVLKWNHDGYKTLHIYRKIKELYI